MGRAPTGACCLFLGAGGINLGAGGVGASEGTNLEGANGRSWGGGGRPGAED